MLKPCTDSQLARIPPPLASHHDRQGHVETLSTRKPHVLHNGRAASPQKKEPSALQNGRKRPWERFTPEAFAQHFHQAVLQSTSSTLQNKGERRHTCLPDHSLTPSG